MKTLQDVKDAIKEYENEINELCKINVSRFYIEPFQDELIKLERIENKLFNKWFYKLKKGLM